MITIINILGKKVDEEMSENQLMKMTKKQLFVLLAGHGKRANNKSIVTGNLVKLIISEGVNKQPKPRDDSVLLSLLLRRI